MSKFWGMPKQVDHEDRRRELAEATCWVVARAGAEGVSLRMVANESGWSIGAIRHYFSTKSELIAFATDHVARRVEERVLARPFDNDLVGTLRHLVEQLVPLDEERAREARVFIAFSAHAMVDEGAARTQSMLYGRLHEAMSAIIRAGIALEVLPGTLDPDVEARRLQAMVDGLCLRVVTAPAGDVAASAVHDVIDRHLASLAVAPSPTA